MAYGGPKRRRDEEPGVHDLVADAAREAGLSVPEFLEQAAAEHEEETRRRRRAASQRQLRLVEEEDRPLASLERQLAGRKDETLDEKRVADIIGRAFEEIRASEARTTELIGRLAMPTASPAPAAIRQPPQSVAEILASAERRATGAANVVELHAARPSPAESVIAKLQDSVSRNEVEKALQLLERQLALVEPQDSYDRAVLKGMTSEIAAIRSVVSAEGAQVPLAAIEEPIRSLTARIGALATAPKPAPQPAPRPRPAATDVHSLERKLDDVTSTTTAMVAGIQDELVRLGQYGLHRDGPAVDASFGRLENRINQLENAARLPLDHIRSQIDDMRAAPAQREDAGLRRSVSDLERKLERLTAKIAQPLQMVHNAVTQLSRQKNAAAADHSRLDQLFGELAMLKRGIAEQSGAGLSAMERQLAAISQRVEAMAVRMQQDAEQDGPPEPRRRSIDDEIDEIKRLLSEAKSPCDDTQVLNAIGQLERKIAALENSPQAVMERLDRLQARMEERSSAAPGPGGLPANVELLLRNLAARLETPVPTSQTDDAAIQRLQRDLSDISRKLDAAPAAGFGAAQTQDLTGVERTMSDLVRKIDVLRADFEDRAAQASAFRDLQPPPAQDLSGVERSIGDLLRQIDGFRSEVGEKAALAAAAAVRDLQPMAAPAYAAPMGAPPSALLEDSLGELRRSQAEAEQRTTRTLEALHETLHRVVDRLGAMEQQARAPVAPAAYPPAAFAPGSMAPMPAAPIVAPVPTQQAVPVTPSAPMAPQVQVQPSARDVPSSAQDDALHLLPPDIFEPRPAAAQPAPSQSAIEEPVRAPEPKPANSFADTLANMRSGRDGAIRPEAAPEPKSAMASAFAAARSAMTNLKLSRQGGADAPAPIEVPSVEPRPAPEAIPEKPSQPLAFDMPLEPGSRRPAPSFGAAEAAAPSAPASSDPKADFIAAARRAAQAAAQQSAAVLAEGEGGKRIGKTGRAPTELTAAAASEAKAGGLRAKHAILLGVAALVVAAGAGYQFMSFNNRAAAPAAEQPQRSSALQPKPAAPRVQQAEAPRQILPPPVAPEQARQPERRDAPLSTAAPARPQASTVTAPPAAAPAAPPARDESITVGSIPAPDRVPAGNAPSLSADDPLLKFEGLKDAPKLRDAARRGDVSAFIELGMRYTEGRGAPRDPKTAALWLERAAEHGSAPAQYRLGTLFREGRGLERDAKKAMKHFLQAAEAGNARAMHNSAVLLAEGVNGAPDYAGAGEWFRKAAEFGIKDSQYNLAILHARGLGVSQDLMASYAWFAAAAAHGDEDAVKKRDEVGSRLSPERLQQARAAAQQWKAKTPDVAANEVPMPAGGWDSEAAKQVPAGANAPKAAPRRL